MMFTDEQTAALTAPLNRLYVKKNPKGFDYVAGWHAIAEANRIFGFANWDRETVEMRQLGEPELVGAHWRVAYHCRVRITVRTDASGEVVRDGSGYGSGIVKDIRDAHESAIKEAETDAMKRALMTFGNPFGLALYDKEQTNVVDVDESVIACQRAATTRFLAAPTVESIDAEWRTVVAQMNAAGIEKNSEVYAAVVSSFRDCKTSLQERFQRNQKEPAT